MHGALIDDSPLVHFWLGGMQTVDDNAQAWFRSFSDGKACWLQTKLGFTLDNHNILVLENEMRACGDGVRTIDIVAKEIISALLAWQGECMMEVD